MIKNGHIKILLFCGLLIGLYYVAKFANEFNASQQEKVDTEILVLKSIPGLTYITRTRKKHYEQFSGIYARDIKD